MAEIKSSVPASPSSPTSPPRARVSERPPRAPTPRSNYREAAAKKGSGQHPAVRAYRDKLQSIADHQGEELSAIDPELEALLPETPKT